MRDDALRRKSLAEEHYPLMSAPPDEEPPFGCFVSRPSSALMIVHFSFYAAVGQM
jgi:hypothetical protein